MADIDDEKIQGLCDQAIATLLEFRARGYIPILMVFSSPIDGWAHAHPISPSGLDVRDVIRFLGEATISAKH
jgi:hypothetical protein